MKVQGEVVLAEDNLISCSFVSQVLLCAREKPSIKNPFNVTACSARPLPSLKREKICAEVRRWLESNPGFLLTEAYLPVDIFKHSIRANGREVCGSVNPATLEVRKAHRDWRNVKNTRTKTVNNKCLWTSA
jgi:hypothetical protein